MYNAKRAGPHKNGVGVFATQHLKGPFVQTCHDMKFKPRNNLRLPGDPEAAPCYEQARQKCGHTYTLISHLLSEACSVPPQASQGLDCQVFHVKNSGART